MPEVIASKPTIIDAAPAVEACRRCGAPVELGDRFCGFCGAQRQAADRNVRPPDYKSPESAGEASQNYFRCQSCGAEVAVNSEHRSYTCAFCDSNYVVQFTPEQTGRQSPEFVIGFAFTPDQARQRFRQWLGEKAWFRPGDLSMAQIEGKLHGAYIPFWSFSMLAQSRWSASIGENWTETETYTTVENGKTVTKTRTVHHTEWWDLAGGHHRYYSGFLISGSRGLSPIEVQKIQPFHLPALKRYESFYLAGWLNEEYSIGRDEALKTSQQEFRQWENENVAGFLPGDSHKDLNVQTEFSQINSDLILLPIYVLGYRYRDKLYRFLVNGQTGKIIGKKPLSWLKIGLAAGFAALLLAILFLIFVIFVVFQH
jgi:hypothetical protein